jgi:hypothetical protein
MGDRVRCTRQRIQRTNEDEAQAHAGGGPHPALY